MPRDATPLPETTAETTQWTSVGVAFRFPHAPDVLAVRLELDWPLGTPDDLELRGGHWCLDVPRPALDRIEYRFGVSRTRETQSVPDPGNPLRVGNPFGDRSEIRRPEYRMPEWLTGVDGGTCSPLDTSAGKLDRPVPVTLWTPDGLGVDVTAPLLLAHDGSDMARRGSLLLWATAAQSGSPFRVALLDPAPGLRDEWYAAGVDYADHVALDLLPAIGKQVAVGRTIGLGASLGALSMLTIARRHPAAIDALALQSGSFFTAVLDAQESGYAYFERICAAVAGWSAATAVRPGPVLMTCGAVEENLANNQAMAGELAGQGFQVRFDVVPDAHTMIGWRDAWSPGLEEQLHQP